MRAAALPFCKFRERAARLIMLFLRTRGDCALRRQQPGPRNPLAPGRNASSLQKGILNRVLCMPVSVRFMPCPWRCSARAGGAARGGKGVRGAGGGGGGGGARQREQRAVRQQPGGQRMDVWLQLHAQQPVCQVC